MMASATQANAPPQAQLHPQGNLGAVLTQFDQHRTEHNHLDNHSSLVNNDKQSSFQPYDAPGSLTINVPGGSSSNTSQDGDDRERSLTLGSEFDLGWALGKDGRAMSISGLLTPLGDPADGQSEGTATTAVTGSTSSTIPTHVASGMVHMTDYSMGETNNQHDAPAASSSAMPRLPENAAVTRSDNVPIDASGQQQQAEISFRPRADSTASQFLNGLYQDASQHQQARTQSQMFAHTPPTRLGTSYENSHFGKRIRSGSISGRLRSASDLEDTGIISRDQKAILKDLIIAGDSSVQGAIDKYEAGDPSLLEEMIKGGTLLARQSDVDLLGDLDLDFLNMHGDDDMMFGGMDDIGGGESDGGNKQPAPQQVQSSNMNDGIGDLLNGYFPNHDSTQQQNSHSHMMYKSRKNSMDDLEVNRMRANSLALPGMLLQGADPNDVSHISFGRWMDKELGGPPSLPQVQGTVPQRKIAPHRPSSGGGRFPLKPQFASECDVLMTSKFKGNSTATPKVKKSKTKKEKKNKEKKKTSATTKKDKKEPRERKSQSKMKDMMESITSSNIATKNAVEEVEEENKEVPSGLGRPRSMSDPNLSVRLDDHGLLHVNGPEGWVGAYSPDSRQMRITRFMEKRNHRVWVKKVKYDVRKNFADSRLRVKGRFVKKEDEMLMRELMSLT